MDCRCSWITQQNVRPANARRSSRRRPAPVRAGLLDTIIKPITSSGEVRRRAAPPPSRLDCPAHGYSLPLLLLQRKPLQEGIANFYDESSQLWESMWVSKEGGAAAAAGSTTRILTPSRCCTVVGLRGLQGEHMHHGYYPKGAAPKSNRQAQVDMIEETLRWAGVERAEKVGPSRSCTAQRGFDDDACARQGAPATSPCRPPCISPGLRLLRARPPLPDRWWTSGAASAAAAATSRASLAAARAASR